MELWDIYDKDKQLTGRTMKRNDWNMDDGDYHLTVLGVIRRSDGRFLITQRVLTKSWAAGCWEVPGGGVMHGESSMQAVRRELLEEIGVDVGCAAGGYVFSYRRDNSLEKNNYFVDIYLFDMDITDNDITLCRSESAAFRFASADEIKELADRGLFLHYDSIKDIFMR